MSSEQQQQQSNKKDKLFFTTTDLLQKINGILEQESQNDASEDHVQEDQPRFELQRRLPDGSTRKASSDEAAVADFQSKLKQVCM